MQVRPMLHVMKAGARRCAAQLWWFSHRDFLLIFNFHRISPQLHEGETSSGTWTSAHDFETGLRFAANEFTIIPLQNAVHAIAKGSLRGRNCAFTIDDGDESVANYALPILTKLGIPATLFVNTAYSSGDGHYCFTILDAFLARGIQAETAAANRAILRNTRDPEVYQRIREKIEESPERSTLPPRRCVSPEWLSTLDGNQFTIGAHGHEHQRFSMMGPEWQRRNLDKNMEVLRGYKAFRPWFAVPFGRKHDFDRHTEKLAAELGLLIFSAEGGINLQNRSPLRRIPADGALVEKLAMHAMAGW